MTLSFKMGDDTLHMSKRRSRGMILPRIVISGPGSIEDIPIVISELSLPENGLIICDGITYDIAGKQVKKYIEESERRVEVVKIKGARIEELERVERNIEKYGFLVGIGGGRPIDIAKKAGYNANLPFLSVPTSASHDGLASERSSIRNEGAKVSMQAKPPLAVIADTEIIAQAPKRLLRAGCGDILSNRTAVLDWKIGKERGEKYSEYAAALSDMTAELVEKEAELISSGEEEGVRLIVKALISSGVAMSIAGTSRPASGGEHKFSHWLDANYDRPALHGEQCGIGSIVTMYLHNGNWKKIKETLEIIGAPTTAKDIGVSDEVVLKAFKNARTIRPERITILDLESDEKIEKAAVETGVVKLK